ncbi:hypothetical protein D3C76_1467840 [compost metagenome]
MALFQKLSRRFNGILLPLPWRNLADNGGHLGLLRHGELVADGLAVVPLLPLAHLLQLHAVMDQMQPSGKSLPGETLGHRLRNADHRAA